MNFTQFLLLGLDRGIISNQFGLEVFYTAFKEAAQGEEYLDATRFHFAIVLLSKTIFSEEDNPFETMFTTILMDKTITYQNSLVGGRIPKTDDETLAVLNEDAIVFYIAYLDRIRALFTSIHHMNQIDGTNKRNMTWREMCERNHGVLAGSFLNFCIDFKLIPHMFNVESLQEILLSVIPPLHKEEYEYFNQYKLITQYEKDQRYISSSYEFHDGEPQLLLHEFIFALGKIALTAVTVTDTESLVDKLKVLFIEKLRFPEIDDPTEHVERYLLGEVEHEDSLYSSEEDLDEYRADVDPTQAKHRDDYDDDPQKMLHDFIDRRVEKDENFVIDYEHVLNELNSILPSIPKKPKFEQVNPPPYTMQREKFGKLLPKPEEDDKNKKKKPQPKRKPPKPKKDEKPKKIYPFEEYPPRPPEPSNLDHFNDLKQDMAENAFPKHFRANECNPGVAPCIIKEVFVPPDAPQEFATLIESALVYQNTANYEMSLATFEEVRDKWREHMGVKALRSEIELYFELSLGSVYESAGRDELALAKYLSAKEIKLVYNHPDQAFPF